MILLERTDWGPNAGTYNGDGYSSAVYVDGDGYGCAFSGDPDGDGMPWALDLESGDGHGGLENLITAVYEQDLAHRVTNDIVRGFIITKG